MPRLLPLLRLLRVGTLFSPCADVIAGVAIAGLPYDGTAARAVGASLLLYAAGMVWNDVADRRLDAVQRPERPLPRGDVTTGFAAALGTLLIAGGVLLSPCRAHHGLIAALVLAYDFGGKLVPWLGALAMGALRALNLATGLALAGEALPADRARDLLAAAGCYAVYIVAVSVLGAFEDEPRVRGRAVAAVQAAPPLAAFAGIATVQGGFWPAPALALLPALWFLRRNSTKRSWDQAGIRRSVTLLLVGTMVYTALLSLAAGQPYAAAAIAAAVPAARAIARRIALT